MSAEPRKFTIVCRGDTEEDVMDGFEEAVRRINDGNTHGGDSRDTAGFYFDVTTELLASEVPA